MGNNNSSATSPDFNPKQWHFTERQSSQNQMKGTFQNYQGNYKILENIHTGELIDQYDLFWHNQQDYRFYLDSYMWRRQQYNIVSSKFIVEQHSQKFCSRSYRAKVYIEHIPTRLSDVTDIPYPDNLYVGLAIMDGYQKLYQNVHHYFPISEDQICVDKEGVVKVWVNSDLSKNYPEPENNLSDNKDESNMVEELLNLLWQNTDQQSQPVSFKQFYMKKKGKRRVGFDEAKVIINEYAKSVVCQIPQRFNSILQMIDDSDEYQQTNQQVGDGHEQNQDLHEDGYDQNVMGRQNAPYNNNDQFDEKNECLYQYQQQNDNEQSQQYTGNNQHTTQTMGNNFIQHYPPPHPQKLNSYNISYNQATITKSEIPMGVVVNPQFIPRQVKPSNGHIITIPPIPGRYSIISLTSSSLSNYQNLRITGQQQLINNGQLKQNNLNPIIQSQQYHPSRIQQPSDQMHHQFVVTNNNKQTDLFQTQNQEYQKQMSMLNPPEQEQPLNQQYEQYQQQNQQQANNEHFTQIDNRNNGNYQYQYYNHQNQQVSSHYPVGRSLQIKNQSYQETIHTNKSNIDGQVDRNTYTQFNNNTLGQYGKKVSVDNAYFEEQPYSSSKQNRRGYNVQSIRQSKKTTQHQQLQTKYYTLETEVDLDEEIAADLRKMIRAG